MGRLASTMRVELERPDPQVAFLLVLNIGGTTYLYGELGEMVPAEGIAAIGNYEAKVMSWGSYARGVTLTANTLELGTSEVVLDDTDQSLTRVIEGAGRYSVRGAAASIVLASPRVPAADWFTCYSGRIDTYAQPTPLTWSFTLSANDLPLQRESLPKATIALSDWPSAALDVRDLPVPILYGRVSSANGADNGAISCHLVDSAGYRYLVCGGAAKQIDAVYKDGIPIAASNYAITRPIVNGRVFTLIDFTSSQGTSIITCDAQGYETVGDGSGTLIVDPPTMLAHLLQNWVWGDYRSGAWLTGLAPIDAASFATTFYSARGYEASIYINTKRRGLDVLSDILKSFEARAYWLANGSIAFHVEDFTDWSYPSYVLRERDVDGWSLTNPTANIVDTVEAKYAQTPTGGYTQALKVSDLRTGEMAPDTIELPYSPAFML